MNRHLILEWYNDQFENVTDRATTYKNVLAVHVCKQYENTFHDCIIEEYKHKYMNGVSIDCQLYTGQPYDDCNTVLNDKLETLWENLK